MRPGHPDLVRRVYEHKTGAVDGFTKKYNAHMFVHVESTEDVESAIQRERTMKGRKRAWKPALIERDNPDWDDLYERIAR